MKILLQHEAETTNNFDLKDNQLYIKMLIKNIHRPFINFSAAFWNFSLYYGRFIAERSASSQSRTKVGKRINCHSC